MRLFLQPSVGLKMFSSFVKHDFYIKNDNLKFQDKNYHLQLYFFLPNINPIKGQSYKVNDKSNSLSFSFSPKKNTNKVNSNNSQQYPQPAYKNTNFSLQYPDLRHLLNIQPNQKVTTAIQRTKLQEYKQHYQWLIIKYSQITDDLSIKMTKLVKEIPQDIQSLPTLLQFRLQYSQYQMMEILIKNSLYELSGLGTIFQAKKIQDIEKINKASNKTLINFQKEIQKFYQ